MDSDHYPTGDNAGAGDSRMDNRSRLRLFLAGDVMTGRGVDQVLPHPGNPALHEPYVKDARDYTYLAERANGPVPKPVGFDYIWGEALARWQAYRPDLRIINLETSITTSEQYWESKGIHYRMHPGNVGCLAAARPDCCLLANNHVLDWGYDGLRETLTTLRRAGLAYAGAGAEIDEAERPLRLTAPGKAGVLVFACAAQDSGVPASWAASADRAGVNRLRDLSGGTVHRVAEAIAAGRRDNEIVLVSIHWGSNWGYSVPATHRRFAQALIDSAGVDVVFGHSSHHAKAIEVYAGRLVIYGSGDFITDYEGIRGHEHYRPGLSPMFFVDLDPGTGRLERLHIVPLRLRRLRLTTASADDREWLRNRLNESSREFNTALEAGDGSLVVNACANA